MEGAKGETRRLIRRPLVLASEMMVGVAREAGERCLNSEQILEVELAGFGWIGCSAREIGDCEG